jgi:hypothetical protein
MEFYVANTDINKLVLNSLTCKDPSTFDLSRCVVYLNDRPINFIKSSWVSQGTFHVNGIPDKSSCQTIGPLTKITFTLKIDCKKEDEAKFSDIRFHLNLSLEEILVKSSGENQYDMNNNNRLTA